MRPSKRSTQAVEAEAPDDGETIAVASMADSKSPWIRDEDQPRVPKVPSRQSLDGGVVPASADSAFSTLFCNCGYVRSRIHRSED